MGSGKIAKVDFLGRVVIPAAYRKQLGIDMSQERKIDHSYDTDEFKENNEVEIECDGSQVTIRPLRSLCIICGSEATDEVEGHGICERHVKAVKKL